jgi:hypothetical protein
VSDRLGAGCLDGRQIVGQNRVEDVDHLPIAVVGAGELAPYTFNRCWQYPVLEGSAVTHSIAALYEARLYAASIPSSSSFREMPASRLSDATCCS